MKWVLLSLVFFAFATGGFLMVRGGESVGYFVGIFFALGLLVGVLNLFTKANYLELTSQGFTIHTIWKKHFVAWKDIREFGINSQGFVGFNYKKDDSIAASFAQNLSGFQGALPDTYGYSKEKLAELLDSYRAKYS